MINKQIYKYTDARTFKPYELIFKKEFPDSFFYRNRYYRNLMSRDFFIDNNVLKTKTNAENPKLEIKFDFINEKKVIKLTQIWERLNDTATIDMIKTDKEIGDLWAFFSKELFVGKYKVNDKGSFVEFKEDYTINGLKSYKHYKIGLGYKCSCHPQMDYIVFFEQGGNINSFKADDIFSFQFIDNLLILRRIVITPASGTSELNKIIIGNVVWSLTRID